MIKIATLLLALSFTAACGGKAFVAGDELEFDGGAPQIDSAIEDSGAFGHDSGLVTDKGSTDGGFGAADSSSEVGFDGALVEDAGRDAAPEGAACDPGPALWQCNGNTSSGAATSIVVDAAQYCLGAYTNPANGPEMSEFKAVADPTACACENTCACIQATNPCGSFAYVGCTDEPGGGPYVTCNVQ
jgi:hypothetical protein